MADLTVTGVAWRVHTCCLDFALQRAVAARQHVVVLPVRCALGLSDTVHVEGGEPSYVARFCHGPPGLSQVEVLSGKEVEHLDLEGY